MAVKKTPIPYDTQGCPVRLGKVLGNRGEGIVYEVSDSRNLAAKFYHKSFGMDKADKLSTMVRLGTDRLRTLSAWPTDLLFDRPGGTMIGFLMPKSTNSKEIHELYGVSSRRAEFPNADFRFLVHAATNVARAFAVIHEHGHVIGDVNQGNLLVSDKATVMLIDCDSFQINTHGRRPFLCGVGVDTFTPPELHGCSFDGIIRTANHDAFGLAVLIFHLLFLGRHPFSGNYLGTEEMPIKKAIEQYRFAYGPNARARQMVQPPFTPALEAMTQPIALLFERAFSREASLQAKRPEAREWISALSTLSKSLRQCSRSSTHYFPGNTSCPWCEIEKSGAVLFNIVVTAIWQPQGNFNLNIIWTQIQAISPPGALPAIARNLTLAPSKTAVEQSNKRRMRILLAMLAVAVVIAATVVLQVSGGAAFWIIIVAIVIAYNVADAGTSGLRREAQKVLQEAQGNWRILEQRWQSEASDKPFLSKLRELENARARYLELPTVRQRRLQQLEANRKEGQRFKFLDRYRIVHADIGGIGPSRKAALLSYGIETAAHVTESAVLAVPGFGPTYTTKLMTWRRNIERHFVFDPMKGVDPGDIKALDAEIATLRLKLEQGLRSGPVQLQQISQQIKTRRESLKPLMEQAIYRLTQAETDKKLIG